jgi:replication-associated recombination protein RarA
MAQKNKDQIDIFPKAEDAGDDRNQFTKDEAVSAWIKEMRLGNVKRALYWVTVMLEELECDQKYVLRRLAVFAFEDAMDRGFVQYVAGVLACNDATKVRWAPGGDSNIPYVATVEACKCTKFWEVPEGRERERIWAEVEKRVAKGPPVEIPRYALDTHTKRGRKQPDERFSGTDKGRMNMVEMYEQHGRLIVVEDEQ